RTAIGTSTPYRSSSGDGGAPLGRRVFGRLLLRTARREISSEPRHLTAEHLIDDRRPVGKRAIGEPADIISKRDARAAAGSLDLPRHAAVDAELLERP